MLANNFFYGQSLDFLLVKNDKRLHTLTDFFYLRELRGLEELTTLLACFMSSKKKKWKSEAKNSEFDVSLTLSQSTSQTSQSTSQTKRCMHCNEEHKAPHNIAATESFFCSAECLQYKSHYQQPLADIDAIRAKYSIQRLSLGHSALGSLVVSYRKSARLRTVTMAFDPAGHASYGASNGAFYRWRLTIGIDMTCHYEGYDHLETAMDRYKEILAFFGHQ